MVNKSYLGHLPGMLAIESPKTANLKSDPQLKQYASYVSTILKSCLGDKFPGGLLCRALEDGFDFYIIAPTPSDWRRLRPLAMAYVGPTMTSFTGHPGGLVEGDPFDDWLASQKYHAVSRVKAPNWVYGLAAMSALASAGEKCRVNKREEKASASELLCRFRHTLASKDRRQAEMLLDVVRSEGLLDALNTSFLHIQLLESLECWEEMRNQSYFSSLCQTRRPRQVTRAMLISLYKTEFEPFESDPDLIKDKFVKSSKSLPGTLFEHYPLPDPREEVSKAFLLQAVTSKEPDINLLKRLREEAESNAWSSFLALFSSIAPKPPMSPKGAKKDPERILIDLISESPTLERAREVIMIATDIATPDLSQQAVEYIEGLRDEDYSALISIRSYSILWRDLKAQAVSGWDSWFERLDDEDFSQFEEVALSATIHWPVQKSIESSEDALAFVGSLNKLRLGTAGQERFTQCLPIMMQWAMKGESFPAKHLVPVYVELLTFYSMDAQLSDEALTSFAILFDGALSHGLTNSQYELAMESASALADKTIGQRNREWLFEMLEMVVLHSSPIKELRDQFLWKVCESLKYIPGNMSKAQGAFFRDIAASMGYAEDISVLDLVAKDSEEDDDRPWTESLKGLNIAIYSLTESAALRAARLLEEAVNDIQVSINTDKAGSDRLKALARNADVFVLVWRSAKHAATEFIESVRPKNAPTLYAKGKGSASIMRELEIWGAGLD